MAQYFNNNTKTVKELYDDFLAEKLVVDDSYQRRKVWLDQDKVRLVETMLVDLVIPEVFFWTASIDSVTGNMITHIVDGQQRIISIIDFITGKFPLTKKYLTEDRVIEQSGDKLFSELLEEKKTKIWTYKLSVVEIDRSFKKSDIIKMFYRLNLTNYNLNSQERRHGKGGKFAEAAASLAYADFWENFKIFSSTDVRRMQDDQYCSSIFILANEGIVDQTNDKKLNDYYDDYSTEFDREGKLLKRIQLAMDIIEKLRDRETLSFISKKAQMYTLFCAVFNFIDSGKIYSDGIREKFKNFVHAYIFFRNEYNISSDLDENIRRLHENIKKYKLASSEGINKLQNRMIRFQILYSICIDSDDSIKDKLLDLSSIYEKTKNGYNEDVEYDNLNID
jgi:hypothetical protein